MLNNRSVPQKLYSLRRDTLLSLVDLFTTSRLSMHSGAERVNVGVPEEPAIHGDVDEDEARDAPVLHRNTSDTTPLTTLHSGSLFLILSSWTQRWHTLARFSLRHLHRHARSMNISVMLMHLSHFQNMWPAMARDLDKSLFLCRNRQLRCAHWQIPVGRTAAIGSDPSVFKCVPGPSLCHTRWVTDQIATINLYSRGESEGDERSKVSEITPSRSLACTVSAAYRVCIQHQTARHTSAETTRSVKWQQRWLDPNPSWLVPSIDPTCTTTWIWLGWIEISKDCIEERSQQQTFRVRETTCRELPETESNSDERIQRGRGDWEKHHFYNSRSSRNYDAFFIRLEN